jgi:hypothetical protein
MNPIPRIRPLLAGTIMTLVLALTFSPCLAALSINRIIPDGRVMVEQDGRVVQVLSEEAPFPQGQMLATEGRCGVRLDDFYLVADDRSRFAINDGAGQREVLLEQGTLYFAISRLPGQLVLLTPAGGVTVQQLVLKASGEGGLLKGYMAVSPGHTEIGVLEGGAMVVSTPEGEITITEGRQITLAQANLFNEEGGETPAPPEEQDEDDKVPVTYWVLGGVGGAAAVAGAVALGTGGSGGGSGGGGGGNSSPVN